MNKGIQRILIGVLFLVLGGVRLATNTGGLLIWGIVLLAYGLFSIGYGIYWYNTVGRNNK